MTTELTSHIALIRAHCTAVIEQSKLASTGPWRASDKCDKDQWYILHDVKIEDDETDEAVICRMSWPYDDDANDALFIATSRQFTPSAAQAVLVALDKLQKAITLAEQVLRLPWGYEGDGGSVGIAEEIIETATEALQSLVSKFDYLWK